MSVLIDVQYGTTLRAITCGECHIPFAIPADMDDAAHKDGRWFHCPNGHKIHYFKTETQQLKADLERTQQNLRYAREDRDRAQARAEAERRSRIAYKGVATKTRNRAAKGMCPVTTCKRHFVNVARHVATQHPDFTPDLNLDPVGTDGSE